VSIAWDAILRHYDAHHRPRLRAEQEWYATSPNLEEAIQRAALATDQRGKRFPHQRRIPREALAAARNALLANQRSIWDASTFHDLLTKVTIAVADVYRTGELYAYDTALRISYYRGLLPTKVYVHAGTRTGARALHLNETTIEMHEVPAELQHRPAHEVEDILCIYKHHFGSNPDAAGVRRVRRRAAP
jgi:ATP-dependent helicase YprA (DUF1998 family)